MSVLESAVRAAYTTFSFMRKNIKPIVRKNILLEGTTTTTTTGSSKSTNPPSTLQQQQPSPLDMKKLLQEMDKITAEELKLDLSMKDLDTLSQEPFTYIDILEGEMISISIFVLHPGAKISLHDHPRMYGLIKVIHGQLGIQSYSKIKSTDTSSSSKSTESDILLAEKKPTILANKDSSPLVLTPTENNFHQIEFSRGENNGNYGAFIDFLIPSYLVNGVDCTYYKTKDIPSDSPLLKNCMAATTTGQIVQLISAPELAQTNNEAYYYGPTLYQLKKELIDL